MGEETKQNKTNSLILSVTLPGWSKNVKSLAVTDLEDLFQVVLTVSITAVSRGWTKCPKLLQYKFPFMNMKTLVLKVFIKKPIQGQI